QQQQQQQQQQQHTPESRCRTFPAPAPVTMTTAGSPRSRPWENRKQHSPGIGAVPPASLASSANGGGGITSDAPDATALTSPAHHRRHGRTLQESTSRANTNQAMSTSPSNSTAGAARQDRYHSLD
ncbi:unnamed protein product, partial [Sphacelaria rigidula]